MKLSPDEEHALKALLGLGLPEKTLRRAILHLRDQELEGRRNLLLAQLTQMDPHSAAAALEGLADDFAQLADDLEDTL